jgi:hypothetical protein
MPRNRISPRAWCGSGMVMDMGSAKTLDASAKVIPCLRRFRVAFSGCHSKVRLIGCYLRPTIMARKCFYPGLGSVEPPTIGRCRFDMSWKRSQEGSNLVPSEHLTASTWVSYATEGVPGSLP